MKLIIFTITILLVIAFDSKAQSEPDTLFMEKYGGKFHYTFGQKEVRFYDLKNITEPCALASEHYGYAKINHTAGNILLGLGAISLAYGLLAELDSGDRNRINNSILAGTIVGGSMIIISIPLFHGKKKQTHKAIRAYNDWVLPSGN